MKKMWTLALAGLLAFAIVPVLLLPKLKHALLYCHYEP